MKKITVSLFGVFTFMFVIQAGIVNGAIMQGWLRNHANAVDVNNDKVITIDELLIHGRDAIIVLDKNKDGKLSQDELHTGETIAEKRAYANPLGIQPGWILVHAEQLDLNKDGILTRLEIIIHAVEAIKALDKNLDSQLTGDECPKLATGEGPSSR